MAFVPKDWRNSPSTDTPITASALEDMEERLSDYTDTIATNAQVVSVTEYGAVGDGVTDDTAAIQAAITAAEEGDTVLFPGGHYMISNEENTGILLKSNIRYSGYGATLEHVEGSPEAIFTWPIIETNYWETSELLENVVFEGFHLLGEMVSDTAYDYRRAGFYFNLCENVRIRDVHTENFYGAGISIRDCRGVWIENCRATHCAQESDGNNALEVVANDTTYDAAGLTSDTATGTLFIRGNYIEDSVTGGISVVMNGGQRAKAVITDNYVENCPNWAGIVVEAGGDAGDGSEGFAQDFVIGNNIVLDSKLGIEAANTAASHDADIDSKNYVVSGNYINSGALEAAYGIVTQGSHIAINGNTVRTTNEAISIGSLTSPTVRSSNVSIVGNAVSITNPDSGATPSAIVVDADGVTVSGNEITTDTGAYSSNHIRAEGARLLISGNNSYNAGWSGIALDSAVAISDVVIVGNNIVNPNTLNSANKSGLYVVSTSLTDARIANNSFHDTRGGGALMVFGILMNPTTATRVVVENNTVIGATNTPIYDYAKIAKARENYKGDTSYSVASASTITVPWFDAVEVTGSTTINTINATYPGHRITLILQGTSSVGDTTGNVVLSGGLTGAVNTTLTVVYSPTNNGYWYEVGRGVN